MYTYFHFNKCDVINKSEKLRIGNIEYPHNIVSLVLRHLSKSEVSSFARASKSTNAAVKYFYRHHGCIKFHYRSLESTVREEKIKFACKSGIPLRSETSYVEDIKFPEQYKNKYFVNIVRESELTEEDTHSLSGNLSLKTLILSSRSLLNCEAEKMKTYMSFGKIGIEVEYQQERQVIELLESNVELAKKIVYAGPSVDNEGTEERNPEIRHLLITLATHCPNLKDLVYRVVNSPLDFSELRFPNLRSLRIDVADADLVVDGPNLLKFDFGRNDRCSVTLKECPRLFSARIEVIAGKVSLLSEYPCLEEIAYSEIRGNNKNDLKIQIKQINEKLSQKVKAAKHEPFISHQFIKKAFILSLLLIYLLFHFKYKLLNEVKLR